LNRAIDPDARFQSLKFHTGYLKFHTRKHAVRYSCFSKIEAIVKKKASKSMVSAITAIYVGDNEQAD